MLLGIAGCLVGCLPEPEFESVYTQLEPPQLMVGEPIPEPDDEPLLTVTGKIGVTNVETTLEMDRSTIEAVGLVEYTVHDPFEEVERTFTGVLMRDLLALWQVQVDATTLQVMALNDYEADIPIELMQKYPVIFALKEDGEYMTPDYRGPAMLVFPYDHYAFEENIINSYWVWQIKAITVK
ncbi:MAG: molybdopterin-dependent oxidoreductase [Cyanothece sp. SIO2G6]|nr:molybdopterin-dependent oxidoreductase [Cyanothece sp. SIO2G6]